MFKGLLYFGGNLLLNSLANFIVRANKILKESILNMSQTHLCFQFSLSPLFLFSFILQHKRHSHYPYPPIEVLVFYPTVVMPYILVLLIWYLPRSPPLSAPLIDQISTASHGAA